MWWKRFVQIFKKSPQPSLLQKEGQVKFFNRKKGYGFIESPAATKDVFVHVSDLNDWVKKGDQVTFELIFNQKGLVAKNVQRRQD